MVGWEVVVEGAGGRLRGGYDVLVYCIVYVHPSMMNLNRSILTLKPPWSQLQSKCMGSYKCL